MSADGRLNPPQAEPLVFPDFNHLPELDDFAKEFLLCQGNAIQSMQEMDFAADLDNKSNLSALEFSEFNSLGRFSPIIEQNNGLKFDDNAKMGRSAVISSLMLCNGSQNADNSAALHLEYSELPSPIGRIPTRKLNHMTLNELGPADSALQFYRTFQSSLSNSPSAEMPNFSNSMMNLPPVLQCGSAFSSSPLDPPSLDAPSFSSSVTKLPSILQCSSAFSPSVELPNLSSSITNLPSGLECGSVFPSPSSNLPSSEVPDFSSSVMMLQSVLQCGSAFSASLLSSPSLEASSFSSCVTKPPSIFQCGSAMSSPTQSSSDGSCATGTSVKKDFISGIILEEDSLEVCHLNPLYKQVAGSIAVTDSPGSVTSKKKFIGDGNRALLSHIAKEASQYPCMQRSHSSDALGQLRYITSTLGNEDNRIPSLPNLETLMPAPSSFNASKLLSAADFSMRPSVGSMRRVYSTGDLQATNELQMSCINKNPLSLEQSSMEEGGRRVGYYTLEERRQKLDRYRQKRTERNFNKKIKYACRKTLADVRPRIRGRFARTDELGEPTITANMIENEDEDEE